MNPRLLSLVVVCLVLTGCDDSASVEPGIEVELKVLSAPAGNACAPGVTPAAEGQSFCTADGERMDLINGLIVPFPLRLVECATVASLLRGVATALLSSAQAHGGAVDAPAGVVDMAKPAGTLWDMGSLPIVPGRYCGLELVLEHLPAKILPQDSGPEPNRDVFLYARPCHFPNPPPAPPEQNHSCHTVAVHGTAPVLEVDFTEPAVLNESRRRLTVTLEARYDTWFDDVDFSSLESDPDEQEKLVQNVLASLVLHAAGDAP